MTSKAMPQCTLYFDLSTSPQSAKLECSDCCNLSIDREPKTRYERNDRKEDRHCWRRAGRLTLAKLLQQGGAQVAVYERDQSRNARVQGSALDLHEDSGLAALDAAGLTEAFWANHRPDLANLRLTDAAGTILHDHPRQVSGPGKRPEIERGPLRDLLVDSLRPVPSTGIANWNLPTSTVDRFHYGLQTASPQSRISPSAAMEPSLVCASWSLPFGRSMSECRS